MAGLHMICKIFGGLVFKGRDGKVVEYVWDYARDEPRLKSEMDAEARAASERAKWEKHQEKIEKDKQGSFPW